ncbi:uncharacterized protein LOC110978112 [Acanthaster planci]|uniref:Uncharacterized protein LOC110978112 n=1 Tax=Acanthaster planci TaxID=133434 RepID=A0A8B7Y5Q0_ACAPL|nr:uncharacterized protein LOC110978112 [Acanthaster planci]
MLHAVNVIDYYVIPKHDYGNVSWGTTPVRVVCTEHGGRVSLSSGTRQPSWFYGSAAVNGMCSQDRRVTITVSLSHPAGGLEEIQYILARTSLWDGSLPWETCSSSNCALSADSQRITISTTVTYDDVSFAVNVIGQEVTEALPFNWRRQPEDPL